MTDIDYEALSEEAKGIANEASKEGKFSFLDRLASRNYPEEDVEVYLDERAGRRIEQLRDALSANTDGDKQEAILAEIEVQRAKARESRYIVHVEGISVQDWDKCVDEATELYPYEYEEGVHPLTMAKQKTLLPNEAREIFFRTLTWSKFIRRVTDPSGAVDDEITPEWAAVFIGNAPIIALAKVQNAIDKARMTSDWMDAIQGDDFLAKS